VSVLVAIVKDGVAAMASDTLVSGSITYEAEPKFVRSGRWLVGSVGGAVGGRFLRVYGRAMKATIEEGDDSAMAEMVNAMRGGGAIEAVDAFVEAWEEWVEERGRGHTDEQGERVLPASFLVASPAGVWSVCDTGSVTSPARGYMAEGSGAGVALGALAVLWRGGQVAPEAAARIAVEAAMDHAEDCGGSAAVEAVKRKKRSRR